MARFTATLLVALALGVMMTSFANAEPTVKRSVVADVGGTAVVELSVSASGRAIHAIMIEDTSGSVEDVLAPEGWVGLTSGDKTLFRGTKPISSGHSLSFRIVTTNKDAGLTVTFSDDEMAFARESL